jgi:hypothetical protein
MCGATRSFARVADATPDDLCSYSISVAKPDPTQEIKLHGSTLLDNEHDHHDKDNGEDYASHDEVNGISSTEVPHPVRLRLHADRRGQRAADYFPER